MLNQYFSDEQIINQICKERIKLAGQRNDHQYTHRLAGHLPEIAPQHHFYQLLPPRRQWAAFRPRIRPGNMNPDLQSLKRAVAVLRYQNPGASWVIELNRYIAAIRDRVFNGQTFTFTPPTITGMPKERNSHEFRALCRFSPDDNLILCLFSQYLRDVLDHKFSDSSYAFRAPNCGKTKTHHDAFTQIFNLKHNNPNRSFYVAECDIRGFFDTVDHGVALQSFERAAGSANLHPRSLQIFQAYLNCYSFPNNVLEEAEPRLKQRWPKGYFKWPTQELAELHQTNPRSLRIGVPQGGALSGIIANLVMDAADKCVEAKRNELAAEIYYYRFCDDMVLLSPNLKHCHAVFDAYLKKLTELKLVFHAPVKTKYYGSDHWNNKSKAPYRWSGRQWFNCVPWVQFVGYQIRYDCLVRPRKGSIKKQCEKLWETTSQIQHSLLRLAKNSQIKVTRKNAVMSLKAKLVAKGVGRVKGGKDVPLPMCWASGYQALHNKPFIDLGLRAFDRARRKQICRFAKTDVSFGMGTRSRANTHRRPQKPYRISYFYQFTNNGGRELIQNPWRPANLKEWMKTLYYRLRKKMDQMLSKYR